MTVTVICEKTGIEFEAASKRTKNHPKIMNILSEANKDGWYADALESIKEGRETGLATIEEFVELLDQTKEAHQKASLVAFRAQRQAREDAKEARRQRAYTNAILSNNGYTWKQSGFADEEEADAFDINAEIGTDYQLVSSDNRTVTVVQAMREIAQSGSQNAQDWLEERNIALTEEQQQTSEEPATSEQAQAKTYEQEKAEAQEARRQQELAERGITADSVRESLAKSDPTKLNEQFFYWMFAGQEDN